MKTIFVNLFNPYFLPISIYISETFLTNNTRVVYEQVHTQRCSFIYHHII